MLDAAYERIESGDEQTWRMFKREGSFGYLWHFHPEYELTVIVGGSGTRFVGDTIEEFLVGDLVLIGPNVPHTYVSDETAAALCCQFGDDVLGAGWVDRPEFTEVAELLRRSRRGLQFHVPDLASWWGTYRSCPARRTYRLLGHLLDLAESQDGRQLTSARYEPRLDRRTMTRIDLLLRYIDDHLAERLVLSDLAEVACLSRSATSRFFRRQTGRTITDYVSRTRIVAACRMLTASHEPVAQIAWKCGFGNLANFHRQFRTATGVTPRAYRREPVGLPGTRAGAGDLGRESQPFLESGRIVDSQP